MNENNNTRIYFVSDMEGCYRIIRGSKQSNYLCSKEFFDKLENLLTNNNKVAFLGDYFEGPECLFSIANMIKLHKKYPDKVYIILGNRDVNKLRLLFEITDLVVDDLTKKVNNNNNKLWNSWNEFYEILLNKLKSNNNNNFKRINGY